MKAASARRAACGVAASDSRQVKPLNGRSAGGATAGGPRRARRARPRLRYRAGEAAERRVGRVSDGGCAARAETAGGDRLGGVQHGRPPPVGGGSAAALRGGGRGGRWGRAART